MFRFLVLIHVHLEMKFRPTFITGLPQLVFPPLQRGLSLGYIGVWRTQNTEIDPFRGNTKHEIIQLAATRTSQNVSIASNEGTLRRLVAAQGKSTSLLFVL